MKEIVDIARRAKKASTRLSSTAVEDRNKALLNMARLIDAQRAEIAERNRKDLDEAAAKGVQKHLVDRLVFGEKRIESRIRALHVIADLDDPIGDIGDLRRMPSGLMVGRMRVPMGVIGMVYESRPHVTVNAGALCVKSGNAAVLRGGSEVINTNRFLGELWKAALTEAGLSPDCVQVVPTTDRAAVRELLELEEYIDLIIPRGGRGLVETVMEFSKIPVIKHLYGVCHVYVHASADADMARKICLDSKIYAPEVCNAAETFLVDEGIAESFLPDLAQELRRNGVEVRGCGKTREIVSDAVAADEEDWTTEYLDLIISIRVVDGVSQAAEHINRYGSGHTETIVSMDYESIATFLNAVDSGVLLVNASTMFCDGSELGMGAEIGISTDKIHARGPMGVKDLTTYKNLVFGFGHCMG